MDIATYLAEISKVYESGVAGEHSYRPALVRLFSSIDQTAEVINEPKRSEGGMPDFVFQRDGVAFGWCEAKDLPKDVIKLKGYSVEQRKRYENAYPNLIYTNGVDFEFIRDKEVAYSVKIADFLADLGGLQPLPENFERLESLLKDFAKQKPISIRSARKLAEMMAGKAEIIKGEMNDELALDPEFRSALGRQYNTFKDNLLPNLTPGEFADIYAETITYGMFAARLHDDTLDTFSRQEALEKLPKSNPFLRGLFQYIAGYDIPSRLRRVVDDLAEVLRASNPHALFEDFGKFTARNDPFIHFYETFLAAYNPKKRKSRGVWYTPEPVVDFIVRAVDGVLKTEFGIADGLADTDKVTVDWDTGETKNGKAVTIKKDVHRVQILDPATGTGTFLAKTVQTIADRVKARAPGKWSSYVEEDLLPRLHGFELLMASYAMCHMKLDMQLTESGYVPSKNPPRLSVWLTNALEPAEREVKDLFFQQLADEARGASEVKRQSPIMCVIGNPPYSISSANKGKWIDDLIKPYKKLDERNVQPLNDDYVKFLAFAEHLIAKNGSGVVGMVTNHGYLENVTFRAMRRHLLSTFDGVRVVDLHGNSNKEEVSPDGSADENVFDIKQGVAILVAWKIDGSEDRCSTMTKELWGKRWSKNEALGSGAIDAQNFTQISPADPYYFFSDFAGHVSDQYQHGFKVTSLFTERNTGIKTHRDHFVIDVDYDDLRQRIQKFFETVRTDIELKREFGITSTKTWDGQAVAASGTFASPKLHRVQYRPFDYQTIYYDTDLIDRHRFDTAKHVAYYRNLCLLTPRMTADDFAAFASTNLISNKTSTKYDQTYFFPLYLYPDDKAAQKDALAPTERTVNFDPKLYAAICESAGIDPADTDMARADGPTPNPSRKREGSETSSRSGVSRSGVGNGASASFRAATGDARPSEVKVFDYIYGVLHSPDYRETFAEFLKIDFPRIPYPASPEVFNHVSEKGEQLRRLHLMEPAAIGEALYPFVGEHEDEDERDVVAAAHPKFVPTPVIATPDLSRGKQSSPGASGSPRRFAPRDDEIAIGRVYINPRQYFDKGSCAVL
eukprot:g14472.t1